MNQKSLIAILIVVVIILAGTTICFAIMGRNINQSAISVPPATQYKSITYGTLSSYFTDQERITYPLIFDDIRVIKDQKSPAIIFGPQKLENFEIFMIVTKMPRKDAENFKSNLIERGLVSEGLKTAPSGYIGEVLSSDLKAHPDSNAQTCGFGYRYFIPLTKSNNDLELYIQASQPEGGLAKPNFNCTIFDDQNYKYLKTMMDYVISNIQPAF